MTEFFIKPIQEDDVDSVYDMVRHIPPLTHHTWYTYWTEITCFGDSCFKALEIGSKLPVGFITSHPINTTPKLEWFCWQIGVLPEYRKHGLGIAMLEHVVAVAQASNAVALRFTIEPDNTASLATFQHIANTLGSTITRLNEITTPTGVEIVYRLPLAASEL